VPPAERQARAENFARAIDGLDRITATNGECREDRLSHLSPPAQKPDRFAALEDIQQQPQRLSPRAFEPGIFVNDPPVFCHTSIALADG
jgi:hypothetical protein